jgi:hypothetical protein
VIHLDMFLFDLSVIRPLTWFWSGLGIAALLLGVPIWSYIRYLRADRLEPRFAKQRAQAPLWIGVSVSLFAQGLAQLLAELRFPVWLALGLLALGLAGLIVGIGLTIREWPRSKNSGDG